MSKSKVLVWGIIVLCFGVLAAIGVYLTLDHYAHSLDSLMIETMKKSDQITSYTQEVTTQVDFADRTLHILGTYHIDRKALRYASFSTTTLNIQGLGEHIFSVENMSFGDTIYTRVMTESPLLAKSIAQTGGWQSFLNTEIPKELENIALSGPTLDNILLFSEDGRFVRLEEKLGETIIDGTTLNHYRFSLSGATPTAAGSLSALIERIGPTGVIEVWVDPSSATIREIRATNETYRSRTILKNIGTPAEFAPPITS